MSNKSFGKILTGCGCCFLLTCLIIFIPLYIRGSRDDIQTKCEVLSKKSSSCTYQQCTGSGSNRRCYTQYSTKYKHKYLIYEISQETCNNKTFSEWSSCRGSTEYFIGQKRKCWVNKDCNNESFNSSESYLIGAWVMLSFACLGFIIYLFGMISFYS